MTVPHTLRPGCAVVAALWESQKPFSSSLLSLQSQVPKMGEAAGVVSSLLVVAYSRRLKVQTLLSLVLFLCGTIDSFFFLLQDYPKNRHPGWSRGSVAYHAGEQGLSWGSWGFGRYRGIAISIFLTPQKWPTSSIWLDRLPCCHLLAFPSC